MRAIVTDDQKVTANKVAVLRVFDGKDAVARAEGFIDGLPDAASGRYGIDASCPTGSARARSTPLPSPHLRVGPRRQLRATARRTTAPRETGGPPTRRRGSRPSGLWRAALGGNSTRACLCG